MKDRDLDSLIEECMRADDDTLHDYGFIEDLIVGHIMHSAISMVDKDLEAFQFFIKGEIREENLLDVGIQLSSANRAKMKTIIADLAKAFRKQLLPYLRDDTCASIDDLRQITSVVILDQSVPTKLPKLHHLDKTLIKRVFPSVLYKRKKK